jgi:hypothetical protein
VRRGELFPSSKAYLLLRVWSNGASCYLPCWDALCLHETMEANLLSAVATLYRNDLRWLPYGRHVDGYNNQPAKVDYENNQEMCKF